MATQPQSKSLLEHYQAVLSQQSFTEREPQIQMLQSVASTLKQGGRLALEAETGVGKTLGYVLPGLLHACENKQALVIATSTVVLQGQLQRQIKEIIGALFLDVDIALGKGRERYACLLKLRRASNQPSMPVAGDDTGGESEFYAKAFAAHQRGWDGDADNPPQYLELPSDRPHNLGVSAQECLQQACPEYNKCLMYRARNKLKKAKVIIVNHDFLIAHWIERQSGVLPDPNDCVLVVDEAHALAEKICSQGSSELKLSEILDTVDKLPRVLESYAGKPEGRDHLKTGSEHVNQLKQQMLPVQMWLGELSRDQHVFPDSTLKPKDKKRFAPLAQYIEGHFLPWLEDVVKLRKDEAAQEEQGVPKELPDCVDVLTRLHKLAEGFAQREMMARSVGEQKTSAAERSMACTPMEVPSGVSALWDELQGLVLTSATLSASDGFDTLIRELHLGEDTKTQTCGGVFDHQEQAALVVVPMRTSHPTGNKREYMQELLGLLPDHLKGEGGRLMIFNSREDMQEVCAHLQEQDAFAKSLLIQDTAPLESLLKRHREHIIDGKMSILCGLRSLTEGLDLPGALCTRILVIRLPFNNPSDPVEQCWQAHYEHTYRDDKRKREWGNFTEREIPRVALRFKQICGRLLRTETDSGEILVFDNRLSEKRYGATLQEALPPYKGAKRPVDLDIGDLGL